MPKYEYVTIHHPLSGNLMGRANAGPLSLESVINKQAAKGYRLHTLSVVALGRKSFGTDQLQAIMVFEKVVE